MKRIILSKIVQQFSNNMELGAVLRENYLNGNNNYNIDEKHITYITDLVKNQPNDYTLGYKVRGYVRENL